MAPVAMCLSDLVSLRVTLPSNLGKELVISAYETAPACGDDALKYRTINAFDTDGDYGRFLDFRIRRQASPFHRSNLEVLDNRPSGLISLPLPLLKDPTTFAQL